MTEIEGLFLANNLDLQRVSHVLLTCFKIYDLPSILVAHKKWSVNDLNNLLQRNILYELEMLRLLMEIRSF